LFENDEKVKKHLPRKEVLLILSIFYILIILFVYVALRDSNTNPYIILIVIIILCLPFTYPIKKIYTMIKKGEPIFTDKVESKKRTKTNLTFPPPADLVHKCGNCGFIVLKSMKKCPNCGADLTI